MPLVKAQCTNCGANLDVDSSKDAAICPHCGTAYIVEKAIQQFNIQNATFLNESQYQKLIEAAEGYIRLGDYDSAITKYKQLVSDYPQKFESWWGLTKAYFEREKAKADNQNMLLEPDSKDLENAEKLASPDQLNMIESYIKEFKDYANKHNQIAKNAQKESEIKIRKPFFEKYPYCQDLYNYLKDNHLCLDGSACKPITRQNTMVNNDKWIEWDWAMGDSYSIVPKANGSLVFRITDDKDRDSLYDTIREFDILGWNLDSGIIELSSFGSVTDEYYINKRESETTHRQIKTDFQLFIMEYRDDGYKGYFTFNHCKYRLRLKRENAYKTVDMILGEKEYKMPSEGGCYIATCVYGSYDCPEVWTLRRFRDNTLASSFAGRAFIKTYYAISPTLVKCFGKTRCFQRFWRAFLDKLVANLQRKGVEDTRYYD